MQQQDGRGQWRVVPCGGHSGPRGRRSDSREVTGVGPPGALVEPQTGRTPEGATVGLRPGSAAAGVPVGARSHAGAVGHVPTGRDGRGRTPAGLGWTEAGFTQGPGVRPRQAWGEREGAGCRGRSGSAETPGRDTGQNCGCVVSGPQSSAWLTASAESVASEGVAGCNKEDATPVGGRIGKGVRPHPGRA